MRARGRFQPIDPHLDARLQRVGDLHGSSHWAAVREVAAAELLAGSAV